MWWFVPWLIIIGFGIYFWLLDREHAHSAKVTAELKAELEGREW